MPTYHASEPTARPDFVQPGDYEVRETQPAGYFSVGAIPGTVDGSATGSTVPGNLDVLTEINLPLGDEHGIHYNFAEAQPASLRGHVEITDRNGDCSDDNPEAITTPKPMIDHLVSVTSRSWMDGSTLARCIAPLSMLRQPR